MSGDGGKRSMVFVDACRPQLTAGKYTLTAIQKLVVANNPDNVATEWTSEKSFWVRGPRFALASDEVYSLYPPDGQTGAFHNTVPHVVFRRKSLPWERKLDERAPGPTSPWMALLLLDEDELSRATFATTALKDVVHPPAGIRGPLITLDAWEEENPDAQSEQIDTNVCRTIEIPGKDFRDLVPRRDELALLAHARSVGTGDKEDVPGIGDGWFSVLLGNRLPASRQRNTALVVSLEGFGDLIEKDDLTVMPKTVRLVVLAKWSFVEEGSTFQELLTDLGKRPDPWLRVTPPAPAQDATVRTALEQGYVPMPHRLRQGDRTVSWYRGPLVPVSIDPEIRTLIYRSADEALQFDADVGLFDVSYAAAWQLGRLLALQAPAFATALFRWKDGLVAQALIDEAAAKIGEKRLLGDEPLDAVGMTELHSLLQDDLMTALALEWCS